MKVRPILGVLVWLVVAARARADERGLHLSAPASGRADTWLVPAGGIVLGAGYAAALEMASSAAGCGAAFLGMDCVPRKNTLGADWPLFVPVVGPFLALKTSDLSPVALGVIGASQLVGAALLVGGLAIRTSGKQVSQLQIAPCLAPGGMGIGLSGSL